MTTVPALLLADDRDAAITESTYNPGLFSVTVYALYLVPGVRVHDRTGDTVQNVTVTDSSVIVEMGAGTATFPSVDGLLTLTVEREYAEAVVAAAM